MKNYTLEKAIQEAKYIRRNLVRSKTRRSYKDLGGDCGLASLILAVRLNDVHTLRCCEDHAWNIIGNTIIDITATQFYKKIRGVYVGTPLECHETRSLAKGIKAYKFIKGWGYENHYAWKKLSTYW